ncbi:MAG: hypothetical protein Q8M07_06530 [Prosthecobacter sp.]|nr:hypothetical protein [Prosthecobacter sp.]
MTTPRPFLVPLLAAVVILHSAFDIACAAPPPELTVLRQQYEKIFAERVTAVHEANVATLDAKFTTALDNAIAQAKSTGDLPTVLAIQGDKKLLAEKQPLPADDDQTPEPLKKLRAIYRDQLTKLTEQKTANVTTLLTPYTAKLKDLEATLTKNDRVEEAKEVMDYRAGLKADAPPSAPAVATTPPSGATPTPTPSTAAESTKLPKGDDRKAAEWVLSIGGKVQLAGGGDKEIATMADLPKGRFNITLITMPSPMPPVAESDFDKLANLAELRVFRSSRGNLSKIEVTDAAFRFLATCPSLTSIDVQNWDILQGSWLSYLAPAKNLGTLIAVAAARSDVSGLAKIGGSSLQQLSLRGDAVDDGMLKVISGFKNLQTLSLRHTPVTDAGVSALASLTKLEVLELSETAVTPKGLSALAKLPLTDLGLGHTIDDLAAFAPELGRLFPKFERILLPPGTLGASSVAVIGTAWPKVKKLQAASFTKFDDSSFDGLAEVMPNLETLALWNTKTTDAQITGIAKHKKISHLNLQETEVTDAALPILQSMKSLKVLELTKTPITDAGLAAFKKQRPDVRIVR